MGNIDLLDNSIFIALHIYDLSHNDKYHKSTEKLEGATRHIYSPLGLMTYGCI